MKSKSFFPFPFSLLPRSAATSANSIGFELVCVKWALCALIVNPSLSPPPPPLFSALPSVFFLTSQIHLSLSLFTVRLPKINIITNCGLPRVYVHLLCGISTLLHVLSRQIFSFRTLKMQSNYIRSHFYEPNKWLMSVTLLIIFFFKKQDYSVSKQRKLLLWIWSTSCLPVNLGHLLIGSTGGWTA